MDITMEQAKVLETVARLGTLQKAAGELNKAHSAVLYALKSLEEQVGVNLFDRSGYRNRLTREGEVVLKFCRQILATRLELIEICHQMKDGWEPSLKLIYDGVVDFNNIADALFKLHSQKVPTEVKVLSAHLNEVEPLFAIENANLMVTILPLQRLQIPSIKLKPIQLHLVAHSEHPLGQKGPQSLSSSDLNQHTFILIKTAPGQLGLGTEQMKFDSYFYVNDFATKKAAILKRLGFGWLPDYLIEDELKKKSLCLIKTEIDNTHTLYPRLYHRREDLVGKATLELIRLFKSAAHPGRESHRKR